MLHESSKQIWFRLQTGFKVVLCKENLRDVVLVITTFEEDNSAPRSRIPILVTGFERTDL